MTTAQRIAALLHDDGQNYETDDGRTLFDLATSIGCERTSKGDEVRYVFADESVITDSGHAWDFGYAECFCWVECGHNDDCEAGE